MPTRAPRFSRRPRGCSNTSRCATSASRRSSSRRRSRGRRSTSTSAPSTTSSSGCWRRSWMTSTTWRVRSSNVSDDAEPATALPARSRPRRATWRTHRLALRAVSEHWNAVPELRSLWLGVVARFTDGDRRGDRPPARRGARAAGDRQPRAHRRAAVGDRALVLRCGTRRLEAELRSEEQAVKRLFAVWRGAVYG